MQIFFRSLLLAVVLIYPALAQEHNSAPFGLWLEAFKRDALAQGISQSTIDEAFSDLEPIEQVIALDRKQPESTLTLEQYLARAVNDTRIEQGKAQLAKYRDLLEKVSAQYHVDAPYIIALWGMETSYGENTGGFDIVGALATLAYDGRRSEFFRGELMNVLKIADREHIPAGSMSGSWAGALGQCQFMPSSYLKYAVDFDGDGKRDVWNSEADVFASIANYLHSEGWNDDRDNNFKVLLKWNRSRYFATAVMNIADQVGE